MIFNGEMPTFIFPDKNSVYKSSLDEHPASSNSLNIGATSGLWNNGGGGMGSVNGNHLGNGNGVNNGDGRERGNLFHFLISDRMMNYLYPKYITN